MLTPAGIKTIIENNFNDDRVFAIQSFVANLIERKVFSDGINRYRIKDTNDNTYVTSLDDFITKIDVTKLKIGYHFASEKMTGDRIHPFFVTINNLEVQPNDYATEDIEYFNMFGGNKKKIMFLLNYISDYDTILPIKIFEVKLIS